MPIRCVAGVALLATAAAADVVDLSADRDNTMFASPGGSISNGAGPHMYVGRNAFGNTRRGLVRFDIAGLVPTGSTITDVKLNLYMSLSASFDHEVAIHRLLRDWGEGASNAGDPGGQGALSEPGDATWLHTFYPSQVWTTPGGTPTGPSPDYVGQASAVSLIGNPVQTYSWTATPAMIADAQGWLDNPAMNFGWIIIGDEASTGTAKRFDTHENPIESYRPRLRVTYTPPASTCYPNCDGGTTAPCLNVADFGCFLNRFAAGDSYANCDQSTAEPTLNISDFACFLNSFAAGCSAC